MKIKSNRQVLTKAIKELNDVELAFLRERLLHVCETTLAAEDVVKEEMKHSIISPDLFLNSLRSIHSQIRFK